MKKLFLALVLLLLTFMVVGCDRATTATTTFATASTTSTSTSSNGVTTTTTTSGSATTTESVESILARTANMVIISNQDNMTTSFTVPAEVGNATVTWASSNTDYVVVDSAATLNGEFFVYNVTVIRPDQTTGNVTVTLTGTFALGDATYDKAFALRVQFEEDASMVTTIAAGLAQPLGTYLTWKDMTILGVGTDGFFFTDGTDIMFVYSAAVAATVQTGEVYNIVGGIGLYNSVPEVQNIGTNLVTISASTASARSTTAVSATVDEVIANHAGYTNENPMTFVKYSVTGKVYYDAGLSANYTTYLIPTDAATLDKAHAIRIYYKSNMAIVSALAGQTITLDLIPFGFNSAAGYGDWYAYFFGTAEDIETGTLTDADKLAISVGQFASSYEVTSSFSLPTPTFGTITNVTVSTEISTYLSYASGTFTVVRPATDTAGTVSVTLQVNAEMQTLVIPVTMKAEVVVVEGDDIFISEYVEGSGTNKVIEIYNPLATTVNLSEYTLELYSNGNLTIQATITLSGTLASGEVYVIYNSTNATIVAAGDLFNNTAVNFNGNDAVVLRHNGEIVDSFGQIGVSTDYAKDVTLVRKASVTGGDSNPNDEFDPATQWDSFAIDDYTHLGTHTTE